MQLQLSLSNDIAAGNVCSTSTRTVSSLGPATFIPQSNALRAPSMSACGGGMTESVIPQRFAFFGKATPPPGLSRRGVNLAGMMRVVGHGCQREMVRMEIGPIAHSTGVVVATVAIQGGMSPRTRRFRLPRVGRSKPCLPPRGTSSMGGRVEAVAVESVDPASFSPRLADARILSQLTTYQVALD